MTDRVYQSRDAEAYGAADALVQQFAAGSDDGWIVPGSSDGLAAKTYGQTTEFDDIDATVLSGFGETSSGSSFDVTISEGEGYVGGGWFARDVTSTVTLAGSTNNQTVYAGWDIDTSHSVIIGLSGAFASDDPKHAIWEFDTDGSGVTSSTDLRNLDDFRVRNEDHQFTQNLTADETLNQHPLGSGDIGAGAVGTAEIDTANVDVADLSGADGTNGQVPQTDGTTVNWASIANVPSGAILYNNNDGASLPSGYVLCDGNNSTPDLRDRYVKGANGTGDEGTTGGTNSVTLAESELPSHTHGDGTLSTDSHDHSDGTLSTDSGGSHSHSYDVPDTSDGAASGSDLTPLVGPLGSSTTSTDGSHSHDVTGSTGSSSPGVSGATGSAGSGSTHQNEPAFTELRAMMKT